MTPTLTTSLVEIPARTVLTVDGEGAPEADPFTRAVRALFAVRAALGAPEDVPLEGTYDQDGGFDLTTPEVWRWRLLVPAPAGARAEAVTTAAARFGAPVLLRGTSPTTVARLLHHGPYVDEAPSLAALYAFVAERGLAPAAPHTEVYLTDPGSVAPAELRTWLQVPVCPAG